MEKAEKKIQAILTEYSLKLGYNIEFPKYRELPDEVKLALSVINNHGVSIVVTLVPISEVKK